ncbi:nuclear pore complex subunit Nup85 [Stagonosporopsis vannaccii]|nr:nuclear pore complex subunit Nup85 [Stagonosporopsis vannaccii]
MFRVPSSTPPSTPGRSTRFTGPTTTPAGPPPDESYRDYEPTSTPAGPPPAMNNSLFGDSQPSFARPASYNYDNSLYGSFPESSPPRHGLFEGTGSGNIGTTTFGRPGSGQRSRPNSRPTSGAFGNSFRVPSSPPQPLNTREGDGDQDMDHDEDEDEDADADEDDEDMDDDEDDYYEEQLAASRRPKTNSRLSQSVVSRASTNDMEPGPTLVRAGAKQAQFDLVGLAKGLAPNLERATLHEPDHVILATERVLEKVDESLNSDTPETRAGVLGDAARELVLLWQGASKLNGNASLSSSRSGGSAGLANASRVASLLLSIHHPPPVGHNHQSSTLSLVPRGEPRQYTPVPKLLLDWLNHIYSGVSEVELVLKEARGYSRHHSFWEAVQASAVRGNFSQTLQLLQGAKLEVAESAQNDGLGDTGYTGAHLRYANEAVRSAVDLLRECPAIVSDDWDIKGQDWSIFRSRVYQVYNNLQEFAEGDSLSRQGIADHFQAPHFNITQSQATFRLSVASRKAESRVPWTVYEELRRLYQLLLGNEEEILAISADWIEAVLGLTIWWNGEDDDIAHGSFAASRRSLMRSQRVRPVDVTPVTAYCQRLSSSLAAVVQNSDEEFSVNVTDRFEVGLACVLDDNIEGALYILRGWSLTAATAIAEVASAGGWYKPTGGLLGGFDQSDLMVLSYNEQSRSGATKDDLQIAYSQALTSKGTITSQDGQTSKEGWELAIQVLSRLDDSITASQRIENIINELPLDSAEHVDRITQLCYAMNLNSQAISIAMKYADHLRANTHNYGDTLLYYARAHSASKIQDVLRVLVAHCLIKSIAYPAPADLDPSLSSLISSPKQTLTRLAAQDTEAAAMLSAHLSGYATLRRFYDLRDADVLSASGPTQNGKEKEKATPSLRPRARARAAASALLILISSSASPIAGGLYDSAVETAVPVDVLLPLLGEALVFLNTPQRTLSLAQCYALVAAVEDFETAGALVKGQCDEVLRTTLRAATGEAPIPDPGPRATLQKSGSALGGSLYSLIGSQDFSAASSVGGGSAEGSAVLVKGGKTEDGQRGWDWRKGFPRGAESDELVRVLRLGIAREVARCFAEGEVTA